MNDSNYVDLWFEVGAAWIELDWFMIRNGRIMTRQTGSLFRNTRFMNRKTGSLFWNTRYMIRNTRCMTRIMWIYDSKYEMHDSNYVDLWFEVGAAWIELGWFMIRNCRIMTRQTGSLFRTTRFINRKTGSLFWNTSYMIRLTGSLTSSGSVYLTTRNDTPPPDDVLSSHNSTTSPRVLLVQIFF